MTDLSDLSDDYDSPLTDVMLGVVVAVFVALTILLVVKLIMWCKNRDRYYPNNPNNFV